MPGPSAGVRIPIDAPAWIRAWPPGLQPAAVAVRPEGLDLDYAMPSGHRASARLSLTHGQVHVRRVHIEPPLEDAERGRRLSHRLGRAIRRQLERGREAEAAARWLSEQLQRCAELPPAFAACARASGSGQRVEAEDAAAALRVLDARTPDDARGSGHLRLACGDLEGALEAWARLDAAAAEDTAGEDFGRLFERMLAAGARGMEAQAWTLGASLLERATDLSQLREAGRLFALIGQHPRANEVFARVFARTGIWRDLQLAMLATEAAGDPSPLVAALEGQPELDRRLPPARRVALALALRDAGAFPLARERLQALLDDPTLAPELARECAESLAHLALWRLDLDEAWARAKACVERHGEGARSSMILGAAALASSDVETAVDALERAYVLAQRDALDDATRVELRVWRMEALAAAGRLDEASDASREPGFEDALGYQLVRAIIELHWSFEGVDGRTRYIPRAILGELESDDATAGPPPLRFHRALARLGGNRSPRVTVLEDRPEGPRLRLAPELQSPRSEVEALQAQLRNRPAGEVLRALDEHAARHPDVPFGRSYAAELDLWTGDYARALERFDALWAETRTRWAYIGAGAAAMFLGDEDGALTRWDGGLRVYEVYLDGEATHTYQAELWRKRGQPERARGLLEHTLASTGTRLGAWINCALVGHALGDADLHARGLAFAQRHAPQLLWSAQRSVERDAFQPGTRPAIGDPAVLERALVLMRGNRSSGMHTFFDDEGRFRVFAHDHARRYLEFAETTSELALRALYARLARP